MPEVAAGGKADGKKCVAVARTWRSQWTASGWTALRLVSKTKEIWTQKKSLDLSQKGAEGARWTKATAWAKDIKIHDHAYCGLTASHLASSPPSPLGPGLLGLFKSQWLKHDNTVTVTELFNFQITVTKTWQHIHILDSSSTVQFSNHSDWNMTTQSHLRLLQHFSNHRDWSMTTQSHLRLLQHFSNHRDWSMTTQSHPSYSTFQFSDYSDWNMTTQSHFSYSTFQITVTETGQHTHIFLTALFSTRVAYGNSHLACR